VIFTETRDQLSTNAARYCILQNDCYARSNSDASVTQKSARRKNTINQILSEAQMNNSDDERKAAGAAVPDHGGNVAPSDWAVAILLTVLVGLSGAALLGATFMELLFDKLSAVTRVVILLPVLLITTFLLVKKWQKLFHRRDAAKK
jgi:hypothetical protein